MRLPPGFPLLVYGRAHGVVPSSPSGDSGSSCDVKTNGGCSGCIVLAPLDRAERNKWIRLTFKLVKGRGDRGWLTLEWNPTSIVAGDNVHPASLPNAQTGEIALWPSSAKDSLGQFFRLGFVLLEKLCRQAGGPTERLFDRATRERIDDGEVHVVRAQFCAYLPAPDVPEFLKGLAILYGQTIACGRGVVNLARLQGLEFEKPHVEPGSSEVTGVTVIKRQGKKPSLSAVFYNKEPRMRQTRQRKGLPELKEATVIENVRLDVTLHSLGVMAVVRRARRRLKTLMKEIPAVFERFPVAKFLAGPTKSTVWALERAIRVLSLNRSEGRRLRGSFSDWLVPYVLQDALRLDVVTGFTVEGYEAFLQSKDKVAVAWRAAKPSDIKVSDDPESDEKNWATFLAKKAGVSLQTVYSRQKAWIARHGIDISLPNAFYYGVLYYGPNSLATPKDQQATLAAHSDRDGDRLLRLRDRAARDFDRLRIDVVGATIRAPLHEMPVEVADVRPLPAMLQRRAGERSSVAIGVSALAEPAGFRISPPKAPAPAPSGVIASGARRR